MQTSSSSKRSSLRHTYLTAEYWEGCLLAVLAKLHLQLKILYQALYPYLEASPQGITLDPNQTMLILVIS